MTHLRCFNGLWIAPVVLATGLLAATTDVRLVEAVKNSDKAAIQTLLPQHIDLSATDTDGSTALHWAVRRDDLETAELIDSRRRKREGSESLWSHAAFAGLHQRERGYDRVAAEGRSGSQHRAPREGETALMTAARTGKVDAVKVLLAHGADVNFKESRRGQTALMWAAAEEKGPRGGSFWGGGGWAPAAREIGPFFFGFRRGRAPRRWGPPF